MRGEEGRWEEKRGRRRDRGGVGENKKGEVKVRKEDKERGGGNDGGGENKEGQKVNGLMKGQLQGGREEWERREEEEGIGASNRDGD